MASLLLLVIISSSFLSSIPTSNARNVNGYGVKSVIPEQLYKEFFLHKDDQACPANGFYTYDSFIKATKRFPAFGNTGCLETRKREIAAFMGQISHETTGGWPTAPDGPYAWGLCFKEEIDQSFDFCDPTNTQWPCAKGKAYFGRGPIQISWNYNYGPAGQALGFDGLNNPDIVANNSVIAFETALWFWMTEQKPKPSCHAVMVGQYRPTADDIKANRTAGYGLVTNIINGGLECGIPNQPQSNDRVGFFERYAALLNVTTGPNLDCANQEHF